MTLRKVGNEMDGFDDVEALDDLNKGVKELILKGDSMAMIEAVNSTSQNRIRQGPLFDEIKALVHVN